MCSARLKKTGDTTMGAFCRFFWATRQRRACLYLIHDNSRAAWGGLELADTFVPFRLGSEDDLTSDAIENPDSPAGFALRWSRLSHAQQVKRALCFANGDWREFQEIVRAAVYFGAPSLAKVGMLISFNGGI